MEGLIRIQMVREHWYVMRDHVVKCLPNEACGILGGIGEMVCEVIPVTNALRSPLRYRMDPEEQLAAMQKIEGLGHEMIGIYHSHIHGPDGPSETDLDEAYYPRVAYLVWFQDENGWQCRAFRLLERSPIEIPIQFHPE